MCSYQHNVYLCTSDQEAGSKSIPILSIILPVVIALVAIIAIAAIMIVLWKRYGERLRDSSDHFYDNTTSQCETQSDIGQSKTAMSVISTLDTELSLTEMKSPTNAADQQESDVPPGGVETSDMKSNIADGCVASDQCHASEEFSSEVTTL